MSRLPSWALKNPRPHQFEEAHDDPAPASICWDCGCPRGHRVHRVAATRDKKTTR